MLLLSEGLLFVCTAWKVSKYGVISGPFFPVFRLVGASWFGNVMTCTSSSKMVGGVEGRKTFSKKLCGGSENFDLKEGLYYGAS